MEEGGVVRLSSRDAHATGLSVLCVNALRLALRRSKRRSQNPKSTISAPLRMLPHLRRISGWREESSK